MGFRKYNKHLREMEDRLKNINYELNNLPDNTSDVFRKDLEIKKEFFEKALKEIKKSIKKQENS